MTDKKKRLDLLPEVLPAPNTASSLTPRQRTMNNLARLAAAAALTAGGCKDKGTDPGYGVVDPMPPPGRCDGLAATITAAATVDGELVVVSLSKPAMAGAKLETGAPRPEGGGTVESWKVLEDGRGELRLRPQAGQSYASAQVPALCPAGPQHLSVSVQLTTPGPDAGASHKRIVHLYDVPDY